MKLCKTCVYCYSPPFAFLDMFFETWKCHHPNLKTNPVSGKPNTKYCDMVRDDLFKCGEHGRWHKERI